MDDGGSSGGVFAELKNVASDAALAVLAPVAKKAATGAAKYAVKKGPELLEDTVKPMLEDAGGVKGLVGQAMSSDGPAGGTPDVTGATGGGGASRPPRKRRRVVWGVMSTREKAIRYVSRDPLTGDAHRGMEPMFAAGQRGKRALALDLKAPEAARVR